MKVELSDPAQLDLEAIFQYTLETWGQRQAETYVDQIYLALLDIEADRAPSRPMAEKPDFLRHKVGSHYLFYSQKEDIWVVSRILHERMDLLAHL